MTVRQSRQLSEHLLVGGWVLDAVSQLGLVAFAARQGDVGEQMQHFAGRGWGRAGGLQPVTPLRGWGYGRGGRVPVEPSCVS